jgi:hypothetical protein
LQRPVFIIFICFLLAQCNAVDKKTAPDFSNAQVTIESEMIIDDAVIDTGNSQDIIAPLWWMVETGSEKRYEETLAAFSENQRYVFALEWYASEVFNGGHDQFFTNSTGIVWKDAIKGLKKIGLKEYYVILNSAIQKLGGDPAPDQAKRLTQMEEHKANFNLNDDQFYALDEKMPLEKLVIDFVKKNRKDFYFKGRVKRPFIPEQ